MELAEREAKWARRGVVVHIIHAEPTLVTGKGCPRSDQETKRYFSRASCQVCEGLKNITTLVRVTSEIILYTGRLQ